MTTEEIQKLIKNKPFEETHIVGLLMLHDDDDYVEMALDNLFKFTKNVYINLNDPTPFIKNLIESRKDDFKKIIYTQNQNEKWNQGLCRDQTVRMLDDVQPDIVLFPDADERFGIGFKEELKVFWEDKMKFTYWVRMVYLWDDIKHYRNDGLYKAMHDVKGFKWIPGLTYLPRYIGYSLPCNYAVVGKETRFASKLVYYHYGYMTIGNRIKKFKRDGVDYTNQEYRKKFYKDAIILELPDNLIQSIYVSRS